MNDKEFKEHINKRFNNLLSMPNEKISFEKGYKEFEEIYESLKDEFNLTREEIKHYGWTEVIIRKGERR